MTGLDDNPKFEKGKRIKVILCKIIYFAINAAIFSFIWFCFYVKEIYYIPFIGRGNVLVIIMELLMYFELVRFYGGLKVFSNRIQELVYSQISAVAVTSCLLFLIIWLLERKVPAIFPFFIFIFVEVLVSMIWSKSVHFFVTSLYPPKNLIIIYGNEQALGGADEIVEKLFWKFKVIKEIKAEDNADNIIQQIESSGIKEIMLCGVPSNIRNDILKFCILHEIKVYIRPSIGDLIISGSENLHAANLPILLCQKAQLSLVYAGIKRFFDIFLSLLFLMLFSPIMLISALAIKVYDKGPVFFRQKRLTKDRKEFNILKFRSMKVNADGDGIGIVTQENDNRITPVGKVIRRFRIDELPQFFNIIKGDMSIVGPRPERIETIKIYEKEIPEFALRLQVKAGLTGYAQIYGKANTKAYDKLQMDLMYVAQKGLLVDFQLMLATVKIIFMPESTEGFKEQLNENEANK